MGIQVALKHRTLYRYDKAVSLGPQIIRLRPGQHCRTPILSYSLDIEPAEHSMSWQFDPSSNQQARVLFPKKTSEFAVEVNLVADMSPVNPFDFLIDPCSRGISISIRVRHCKGPSSLSAGRSPQTLCFAPSLKATEISGLVRWIFYCS